MLLLKEVLASEGQTYGRLINKGAQTAQQRINPWPQLERNGET